MELVRALRGARTQKALSRRLGYQSNVLFAWESGRDAPTAAKFFRLAKIVGANVDEAVGRLGRGGDLPELSIRAGVAELARRLRGGQKIGTLADKLGRDRFAVGRWLSGATEIPLPDFLRIVEATSLGLVDFVSALAPPESLPSIQEQYSMLEAARRAACELPWSHAIVFMVDLPEYQALSKHVPGWFGSRLGISLTEEQASLALLLQSGRLREECGRYRSVGELAVNTRLDPDATRKLAGFWMRQGAERVLGKQAGKFAFNAFGVSREGYQKLRELETRYFAELRSIVSDSSQIEVVAVATFQLFPLAGEWQVEATSPIGEPARTRRRALKV